MTKTTWKQTSAAAVAVLALALAGCGSSDGSDGAAGSTTTAPADSDTTAETTTAPEATDTTAADDPTTTVVEDTTPTTEDDGGDEGRDTETSQLDTLSDGDHIGYIAGVEKGVVEGQDVQVILFDEVEVLTGQAAIDAAAEDGVTLDTDYYVRDADATVVSVAVVPEAQVTRLDGGSANQVPASVDEVAAASEDALFSINTSTVREITLINSISGYYLA